MKGFNANIEQLTLANENFRKVLYTSTHMQLVLMSLLPGQEIGEEIHKENDQFFRFEQGTGKCVIDGNEYVVTDGDAIIIPSGAKHNVINTGVDALKMYTIYAPPHHKDGIVRATKKKQKRTRRILTGRRPNKMRKWKLQYTVYPVVLTGVLYVSAVYAQNNLPVERSLSHYKKEIKEAPYLEMVELKSREPSIVYDFKYATRNNFMGRYMYPAGTRITFLRKPAADSLIKIQRELNKEGLGLKVFDAYRPYSVTRHFWELVKDERYVANPAKGSHHNRGTAIDLTID